MKGKVRSYLPAKGYGFIRGDDGRDYYFNDSAFGQAAAAGLVVDGSLVEFEERATPKGYRASRCRLVEPARSDAYEVPDSVLSSRSGEIKGWEVLEHAHWIVHASSRDSPDAARRGVEAAVRRIDANGVIELEYYKSTGSEAGTGRGRHHYTIHHFKGRPVVAARRHADGKRRASDLFGINVKAQILKQELAAKTASSSGRAIVAWIVAIIVALIALGTQPLLLVVPVVIVIMFGISTNHDSWLEFSPIAKGEPGQTP